MSGYYYLDIALKFQDDSDLVLTPAYFKGSIDQSLRSVFGEIGGLTEVDICKLDPESRQAIIRIPEDYYVKTRAAITLISEFQEISPKMSLCQKFGKDKVIFVTKEDHATPSTVELPSPEPPQGLITPAGEINWGCPCLGGMATGPCGVQFREAFSCFHYSEAEPKGSDCYNAFKTMQDCFTQFPTVYNKSGGEDDDDNELDLANIEGIAQTEEVSNSKKFETDAKEDKL